MFSDYVQLDQKNPSLLANPEQKLRSTFRLSKTNVTIANTLRRAIISDAPSVAFRTEPAEKSDVVISVNTTPLVNEMIALRIGLIPINADPMTFNSDEYEFELDKQNNGTEIIDVTASDFKVYKHNPENPLERISVPTESFFPPDPITKETVLITRLRPKWNPTAPAERISLKAKATVSSGRENVRWSPTSQCSYEYTRLDKYPQDESIQNYIQETLHAWLKLNKKIVDPKNPKNDDEKKKIDMFTREFHTMEVQRCYFKDPKTQEPNDFTFFVESVGVQPVPQIVDAGLSSIIALVERYQNLDTEMPSTMRLQQGDARFPCIDVFFTHEDHTLGNLLSTYLEEHNVKNMDEMQSEDEPTLTYVGYKIPHPLRPEMFVRIALAKLKDNIVVGAEEDIETLKAGARYAVANACRKLRDIFQSMRQEWNKLHIKSA